MNITASMANMAVMVNAAIAVSVAAMEVMARMVNMAGIRSTRASWTASAMPPWIRTTSSRP